MNRILCAGLLLALLGFLPGCAGTPPLDWQINSHGAIERAAAAYLQGNARVEALEFERARTEIGRTGRSDLLARAELLRCATRVASLAFEPCAGYEKLQADVGAGERAYARYLRSRPEPGDAALLPTQHRAVAESILARRADAGQANVLRAIADPLSRLVAAGVLFQAGLARPPMLDVAVETASDQAWSRPLLAWLQVQASLAEQTGAQELAQRLRRRIGLVLSASGQ